MGGRGREGPALCLQGVKNTQFGSQGGVSFKGRPPPPWAQEEAAQVGVLQTQLPSCAQPPLVSLLTFPIGFLWYLPVVQNYHHCLSPLSMVTWISGHQFGLATK